MSSRLSADAQSGEAAAPESFVEDAGLTGASINAVDFGPSGELWLATSDGLRRFDGVRWTSIATEAGLPSAPVTAVKWDAGALWVGTEDGAWCGRNGRFDREGPATGQPVRRIVEGESGELWMCTAGGTYRRRGAVWEAFPSETQAAQPVDVVPLGGGRVFVVAEGKMLYVHGDQVVELPVPAHLDLTAPASAFFDPETQRLVISTGDGLRAMEDARAEAVWRPFGADPRSGARMALLRTRAGRVVAFTGSSRRFVGLAGATQRPLSQAALGSGSVVHGLAEAPDGCLWAFGDGVLLRWQPPDDAGGNLDIPPPLFEDATGRVWFADAQRVRWQFEGTWGAEPGLATPSVRASRRVLARSRRGDEIVVWQDGETGDGERRVTTLPFRPGARLHLVVDGTDVAWAVGVEPQGLAVAWLDPTYRWRQGAIVAAAAAEGSSVVASADPRGGLWLVFAEGDRSRLVRIGTDGSVQDIDPPEKLVRGDVAVDAHDRAWVIGASGVWTLQQDATWRQFGDRWTHAVEWIRRVGDRIVLGCLRCRSGAAGIVVLDGEARTVVPASTPRVVGCDQRGLFVASDTAVHLVPASGPVTTLPGIEGRDVAALVVDRAGRAWVGRSGRSSQVLELPLPHALLQLRDESPTEGSAVGFDVKVAFAYVPSSRLVQPAATLSWRVDDGPWTSPVALSAPAAVAGLAAGPHRIDFLARDALGRAAPIESAVVRVRAQPLQDRPWFPLAVTSVGGLMFLLAVYSLLTSRRLAQQTGRLRAAVERRTRKMRGELLRRRRAERNLRHQHRVLALLATGKPVEPALEALVLGLEEQLPRWRGAICQVEGDRLLLMAAPGLGEVERALLDDGQPLTTAARPWTRAVLQRHTVIEDAEISGWSELTESAGVRSVLAQPIQSTNGAVLGVLVLLRDVVGTLSPNQAAIVDAAAHIAAVAFDSQRVEAERHHLQQQILNAQKLRSLGLLAGGVAHDFNNLLTGILGHAGLARMQAVNGSPVDQALAQVEKACERAADLCAQLLAFSGRGRFVVKPVDLSALVQEMVSMLRLPMSPNIALELSLGNDLPAVEADVTQVRQVVMNLITNAAEAIGDVEGRVAITTGVVELGADRLRAAMVGQGMAPGRYVFVEVSDSGCGMDDATCRGVFEPFFTTKASGRGLGMAAVHGIVQGHRGAVELDSQVGRGTTIGIFFPASRKVADRFTPVAEAATPALRASGLVLVAEDDPVVRELARTVLTGVGFEVAAIADGIGAARLVADRPAGFRMALLDIVMPGLTGREVLAQIRRRDRSLPVILSSGNEMAESATSASDPHTYFLKKPYGPQGLLEVVRRALDDRDRGRSPARLGAADAGAAGAGPRA